jgi:hypothetical protein
LKNLDKKTNYGRWPAAFRYREKRWFLNYGESTRCFAVAGISLPVNLLTAQKHLEISFAGDASRALNNNK